MKTKNIKQWLDVNASAQQIYDVWMDSKKHAKLVGSSAKIDPKIGGKFEVWGWDITGENVELVPGEKIVQTWRNSEWPEGVMSKITLKFKKNKDGTTRVLFWHSGIPEESLKDIEDGSKSYYWESLKEMFN